MSKGMVSGLSKSSEINIDTHVKSPFYMDLRI